MESLLKVFDMLNIEERQKLIPKILEKAGIINRENVNDISDEKEREFVIFLFTQIDFFSITTQYIEKCRSFIDELKNGICAGSMMGDENEIYFYLHYNANCEDENYFHNFSGEDISREEFFTTVLFQYNDRAKLVNISKNSDKLFLCDLLRDLHSS